MIARYNDTTYIQTKNSNIYKDKEQTIQNKKGIIIQKMLGALLILVGIIGFSTIPEDNGAFLLPVFMGLARIIY